MDLKATIEESDNQSAFGFIQNNVSESDHNSTTAFSFMQSPPTSILDTGTSLESVHEKRSSFSFLDLSGQGDVATSTNSNIDNISVDKGSGPNGSNVEILSAATTSAEGGVIKLGKTSATKAVSILKCF